MNDKILNEVNKKGIFIDDQLLNDSDKNNLKRDFEKKKDYEFIRINDDEEIKKISDTLFNFLHYVTNLHANHEQAIFEMNDLKTYLNLYQYL